MAEELSDHIPIPASMMICSLTYKLTIHMIYIYIHIRFDSIRPKGDESAGCSNSEEETAKERTNDHNTTLPRTAEASDRGEGGRAASASPPTWGDREL